MEFTARRVVTGHDADGRDVIRLRRSTAGDDRGGRLRARALAVARRHARDRRRRRRRPRRPRRLEPPPGGCSVHAHPLPRRRRLDPGRRRRPRPSRHARHRHPRLHGRARRSHRARPRRRRARARRPATSSCSAATCTAGGWRATHPAPTSCAWSGPIPRRRRIPPWRWRRRAPPATGRPRRLVAATRDDGTSYALTDGSPPCALSPGADDGVALVELWQSGRPAGITRSRAATPTAAGSSSLAAAGVAFRWVRLPAGHDPGAARVAHDRHHRRRHRGVGPTRAGAARDRAGGDRPRRGGGAARARTTSGNRSATTAVEFVSLMLAVG